MSDTSMRADESISRGFHRKQQVVSVVQTKLSAGPQLRGLQVVAQGTLYFADLLLTDESINHRTQISF